MTFTETSMIVERWCWCLRDEPLRTRASLAVHLRAACAVAGLMLLLKSVQHLDVTTASTCLYLVWCLKRPGGAAGRDGAIQRLAEPPPCLIRRFPWCEYDPS